MSEPEAERGLSGPAAEPLGVGIMSEPEAERGVSGPAAEPLGAGIVSEPEAERGLSGPAAPKQAAARPAATAAKRAAVPKQAATRLAATAAKQAVARPVAAKQAVARPVAAAKKAAARAVAPPSEEVGLVWFRRDLRLDDNPAWAAARSERRAVVPLYVIDPRLYTVAGPYRRRQLVASLQALDFELFERTGGRLLVRTGDPVAVVTEIARALRAGALYWNADVTPFARRRDDRVRAAAGVPVRTWYGSLVLPPGAVRTPRGELPRTFGAFHERWSQTPWDPWPEPGAAVVYDDPGDPLPLLDAPPPLVEGAAEARNRLVAFLAVADDYQDARHRLEGDGRSSLSADLHLGTLSPRAVVQALAGDTPGRRAFRRELARRDWYAHRLASRSVAVPRDEGDLPVAWRNDPRHLSAWKGGFTGYPLVDAAMRCLRETGRLHHRLRALAAAFLVCDLLVDWRLGERHFRHLLLDGDVAQNVGNWLAVVRSAGGAPADEARVSARVPHPVTQSRVDDPEGVFIRRWVPELAGLSGEHIHEPWAAPAEARAAAGVELGRDYPGPIVDHAQARTTFLELVGRRSGPVRSTGGPLGGGPNDGRGKGGGAGLVLPSRRRRSLVGAAPPRVPGPVPRPGSPVGPSAPAGGGEASDAPTGG